MESCKLIPKKELPSGLWVGWVGPRRPRFRLVLVRVSRLGFSRFYLNPKQPTFSGGEGGGPFYSFLIEVLITAGSSGCKVQELRVLGFRAFPVEPRRDIAAAVLVQEAA